MAEITWDPPEMRPANAEALEAEIAEVSRGARVKLTLKDGVWLVRALLPAALCQRKADFAARDVSRDVAEALRDADLPARP